MEARMNYVDGFVVPVPKSKLADYRRMAKVAGKVWREHGAVEYVECVADDVKPGKHTSFPQSVKLKPGEVVVFSWVVYKSRAQTRPDNEESHDRSAPGENDESQDTAVRRQAHVLGRIQDDDPAVGVLAYPIGVIIPLAQLRCREPRE
jgi:uncharacterized protein YbaA (DUF1428 family)